MGFQYYTLLSMLHSAGSTEAEWSIPEAGLVWADCLLRHFGIPLNTLSDNSSSSSRSNSGGDRGGTADDSGNNGVVLVTIGGGHYVPKMNDAVNCPSFSFISSSRFIHYSRYMADFYGLYFLFGDFVVVML